MSKIDFTVHFQVGTMIFLNYLFKGTQHSLQRLGRKSLSSALSHELKY